MSESKQTRRDAIDAEYFDRKDKTMISDGIRFSAETVTMVFSQSTISAI